MATPRIVRDADLDPSWDLKRAREDGFRRSLTTWVGGPDGHINSNQGVAAESRRCALGLMRMAVGERQPGVHIHSVTEIYVILAGAVESFDGVGAVHRAGPLDCLSIPVGVPHGVRAVGDAELELIWIHDAVEPLGVSTYLEGEGPFPAAAEVTLVPASAVRAGADQAGLWVARSPEAGSAAAPNRSLDVARLDLAPGGGARLGLPGEEVTAVVIGGVAEVGAGRAPERLGRLDAAHVADGPLQVTNAGEETLSLLVVSAAAGPRQAG